jgi:hypothetical protein
MVVVFPTCVDADLWPHLRERQRSGRWLKYHLVEVAEPHRITGPPLASSHPVEMLVCGTEVIRLTA